MESKLAVVAQVTDWLEKAVIGLNLCPFAKAVHVQKQIRYIVSEAQTEEELIVDLQTELEILKTTPTSVIDTTLLIHPKVLADFLDYNDFLDIADQTIEAAGLADDIQIASFHPRYQFAGTGPDDIENYTNRAPYPILQLLRESSVEVAIDHYEAANGDVDQIFEKNIRSLNKLGIEGWKKLGIKTT